MHDDTISGTDWSTTEVELVVANYFEMLGLELAQRPYVKSYRNDALQISTGRSRGSIEFKNQNISAVLQELGLPWISGYKPRANYQRALLRAIERILPYQEALLDSSYIIQNDGLSDVTDLIYEAPPLPILAPEARDPDLETLVRKFDPAVRDERNRALGKRGEERIFHAERARLSQQNSALARKVKWVSQEDGDGAGFDILSYNPDGSERLIEVKTTSGHQTTPFFISSNEIRLSNERPREFRLGRVDELTQV